MIGGSQRIASELMGAPFDADDLADPPLEGPGGMEKTQSGSSYPSSGAMGALSAWASFDTLLQRLDITTDPDFWDGLVMLIPYQDYFLESQYNDLAEGCVPGEAQQGPNKIQTPNPPNQPDPECLCANSPFYAWEIHGIECTEYRLLYWYHPDYGTSRATVARSKARLATVMRDLGHNEFITDYLSRACRGMAGLPYQYFHYSAFGETLVEDNAHYGQFSSPYRFNAKELDGETGNYYYGARYYNPTWSVWLSVDPMSAAVPSMTPYRFCLNNPINIIDPTGLLESTNVTLNEDGSYTVVDVIDDGDNNIYVVDEMNNKTGEIVGQTENWDEFMNHDKDGNTTTPMKGTKILKLDVENYLNSLNQMVTDKRNEVGLIKAALWTKEQSDGRDEDDLFDIKKTIGSNTGYYYRGYYYTGRSFGNILAGMNAAVLKPGIYKASDWWRITIIMAGDLHMRDNKLSEMPHNGRWMGEIDYAGRMIFKGFNIIKKRNGWIY